MIGLFGCGQISFDEVAADASARDAAQAADARTDGPPGGTCGNSNLEGDEVCDPPGPTCSPDCSERWICGDGARAGEEVCDDGNSRAGDGCENDCTFSCSLDAECSNGLVCDGEETCNPTTHACQPGLALDEASTCDRADGATGTCRGGLCAAAGCGNGVMDPGEACDDDNRISGDGCENDCSFSCESDASCDDANSCNGVESCSASEHFCSAAAPVADGTICDREGDGRTICRAGECLPSLCGDGYLDVANLEACDDGNRVSGDGCDNDCQFSCTSDDECRDLDPCNGTESCSPALRRCVSTDPLANDTPCGAASTCQTRVCTPIADSGVSDAGNDVMVVGGEPCGDAVCIGRQYCCNASCGICADLGGACTTEFCPPAS